MAIDPNVFSNIKTFGDYNRSDQAFQAQQQGAQIENASKAGLFAAQKQAEAAASGNQSVYDAAKQQVASMGIDTSTWAPDIATGAQQAQNSLIAHSSLPGIINAQQRIIGNNIAATALGLPGGGLVQPVGPTITPLAPVNAPKITATSPPMTSGNAKFDAALQNGGNQLLGDENGGVNPQPTLPQPPPVNLATQSPATPAPFSFRPQQPTETAKNYMDAQQQAFEQWKTTNAGPLKQDVTQAEGVGKNLADRKETAIGNKDILRLYNKLGTEAPGVPGGMIENAYAGATNALNAPSQGAINKGAYDADLNNLYLATIRSMKGTGRVMQAELKKIAEAAPAPSDSTEVKISKVNAHLEDYNQRMKDIGYNPSNGLPVSQDNPATDVPSVTMPNAPTKAFSWTIKNGKLVPQ